ncbi:MAG: hypothetical protein H6510_10085 [Acidobacteria bacterium]|nr:hypothetical protein [Acidobacteriota bacterium]MCB9398157.1 hypothetical protein [Acidobacteriota bacterium]
MRFLALLCVGAVLWGQTTFQEQAQRLMNIQSYLLDLRPATAPEIVDHFQIEAILDLYPQPDVNARIGNKEEALDPPSWVPKLRFRGFFRNGLMIGGAWAPGIDFQDYRAEFIALELGYRRVFQSWTTSVRASYSDGEIEGAITDPDFEDLFQYKNSGLDISVGHYFGRAHVYGFVGWNETDNQLDIALDGVHLEGDDGTYYGGLGVQIPWNRWRFNLEQNATDTYLRNLILSASYRFGRKP